MNFNVVGIGEVLWDLLLTGPQLGGAPANFAYHANALGAHAYVVTRVGDDDYGREIIRRFREMGIRSGAIQVDKQAPTGTATVALSGNGLAHFTVHENVAWDFIAPTHEALALVAQAHAICFGSLAQRSDSSRQAIQQLLAAAPTDSLRVFDINLRQNFYSREVIERSLQIANVLKLNDDELPVIAEMLALRGTIEEQLTQLATTFHLRLIALTRGAQGSLLYQSKTGSDAEERWSNCPSRPVDVVDTVGAGDSFTAALVMGLLRKIDLDEVNLLANDVARYVCSHTGATPALPMEFAKRFELNRSTA
jgi:Sugar kinases, ribokinase family